MGEKALKIEFLAKEENEEERLDRFLQKKLTDFTRSRIQRLIKGKYVLVSGRTEKAGYKVKIGDIIEVSIPHQEESEIIPENIPIEILYEDDYIVVINKRAGIVVHSGAGVKRRTLVNALLFHRPEIAGVGSEKRPGIVHRLDKETSGVMVVAKNDFAYHFLQKEFKERRVKKEYIAIVKCRLKEGKGRIELSIGRDKKDRKKISTRTSSPREAITEYEFLKELGNGFELLSVKPETGRTHQIRVHLKAIGCPIAGDKKYGGPFYKRLALHSYSISFVHPYSKEEMKFIAPLPEDFLD
ncbi:MAG: RluA family pseudouridine synthase [Candidatus Aminicenantia bacterium]